MVREKFDLILYTMLIAAIAFILVLILSLFKYSSLRDIANAMFSSEVIFAVKLSMATSIIATIFAMCFAVPIGYVLARKEFLGKDFVDALLDLPLVMPPIALGAALLIFFNTFGAGLDRAFSVVFTQKGIVVAQFTVILGFGIRFMKSSFESLPKRYEEIARTLGLSSFGSFAYVALPMSKSGIMAASILTWARAVGEFGATVTLAGATKMKTETLPIAIFLKLATAEVEKAISVVLILILIAVTGLIAVRKAFGKGYEV